VFVNKPVIGSAASLVEETFPYSIPPKGERVRENV